MCIHSSEGVRENKLKRDRTLVIALKGNVEGSCRGRFRAGAASADSDTESRQQYLVTFKKSSKRKESTVKIRRGDQRSPDSRQISGKLHRG